MQRVGGRWMGADGLMHAWDACHVSAWPGGRKGRGGKLGAVAAKQSTI